MDRLTYPFVTARSAPELPSDHAPLRRTDLLFILGFWTFIALLMSANTLLDPGGTGFQIVPPAPGHPRAEQRQRLGARPHRDAGAAVSVVQCDLRLGYPCSHRGEELLGLRHRYAPPGRVS